MPSRHTLNIFQETRLRQMAEGHNPNEVKVFSWNIMGQGGEGWTEARKAIVLSNIRGYDIVFLQEVQWVERGTEDRLAAPAGYTLVMTRSESGNRNSCILYNSDKLQCEDDDTDNAIETLESVEGWTTHREYSKRLCLQVFKLKEKGDTSKFVAISLHAPKTNTKHFCEMVKAGIEKVVDDHKLPVLAGGDFNKDIYDWKDRFLGPHLSRHKRIDFIVMKVPKENHLKMTQVQQFEDIDIQRDADVQSLEVVIKSDDTTMITVRNFKEHYTYDFFVHLCDSHMPLTVVVTYHNQCVGQEQERIQDTREAPTAADARRSQDEIVAHLTDEIATLQDKVAELEGQCRRYQRTIEDLEQEVRNSKERFQRYQEEMEHKIALLRK